MKTIKKIKAKTIDAMGGGLCPKHGKYYGHGKYGLRACPYCDVDEFYKMKEFKELLRDLNKAYARTAERHLGLWLRKCAEELWKMGYRKERGRVSENMTDTNKKCEERIDEELKERIKEFEQGLKEKDFIEWINNNALAYCDDPEYRGKRLELSWGGPQDYFVFHDDGTISYHFLDWFDGAKRYLYGRDLEIMEQVRDGLEV